MLVTNLGNNRAFAADDLRVILGIDPHFYRVVPEFLHHKMTS